MADKTIPVANEDDLASDENADKTNPVVNEDDLTNELKRHDNLASDQMDGTITIKEDISEDMAHVIVQSDPLAPFTTEPDFCRVSPILLADESNKSHSPGIKEFNFAATVLTKTKKGSEKGTAHGELSVCHHCKRKLSTSALIQHNRIFSKFTCPKCNIQICNRRKLVRHITSHSKYAYQCERCLKGFNDVTKFKSHKRKSHHKKTKTKSNKEKDDNAMNCCKKEFKKKSTLMKHRRMYCSHITSSSDHVCNVCRKQFRTKEKLDEHIVLHQISYKECKECEECFDVDEDDKDHECTGVSDVKFVYNHDDLREKIKSKKYTVKKKCRTRTGKVCVRCICGFQNRDDFYQHINSRTCINIKSNSQCMLCKKLFQSLDDLKVHVMACFKDSLTSLLRPHSKDTKRRGVVSKRRAVYHCSRCSTLFPSIRVFKKHKLLHNNTGDYSCYNCEYRCLSKRKMKKHVRERTCMSSSCYSCFLCDDSRTYYARFGSISSLSSHLKGHKFDIKKKISSKVTPARVESDSGLTKLLTLQQKDIVKLNDHSGYCHVPGYGNFKVSLSGKTPHQVLTAEKLILEEEVKTEKPKNVKVEVIKEDKVKKNETANIEKSDNKVNVISRKESSATGKLLPSPSTFPSEVKEKVKAGHKCFECSLLLNNETDILNHFRIYHKWRIIQLTFCNKCNTAFKDVTSYEPHASVCQQGKVVSRSSDCHAVQEKQKPRVEIECDCTECRPDNNTTQCIFIYCKVCNEAFQCYRQINYHQILKHPSKPYIFVCESCDLPFLHYESLREHHKSVHHSSSEFKSHVMLVDWPCYLCKTKITSLATHINSHAVVMLECYQCNVKLSSKSMLVMHINKTHKMEWKPDDDSWVKMICDSAANHIVLQLYRSRGGDSRVAKHELVERACPEKDSNVKCTNCAAVFFHKATLDRHLEMSVCQTKPCTVQSNLQTKSRSSNSPTEVCKQTDTQIKSTIQPTISTLSVTGQSDIQKSKESTHVTEEVDLIDDTTVSPLKYFQTECSVCSRLFYTKGECALHISKMHHIDVSTVTCRILVLPSPGLPLPGDYRCDICYLNFRTDKSLWKHRFEHLDVNFELCHICQRAFSTVTSLKLHILSFHKGYLCMCCYKAFHSVTALKDHSQIHVLEVNVPRDENGKMVIEVDDMIDDKGRKKEKLSDESDTYFYISSKIPKKHLEDSRLFYCQVCQKNIEGELTFIVHMKTHTVPRRLLCIICREKFCNEEELELHMDTHFNKANAIANVVQYDDSGMSNEAVDKCKLCSEVFISQVQLNKHINSPEHKKTPTKFEIKMADSVSFYVKQYVEDKVNGGVKKNETRVGDWSIDWQIAEKNNLSVIFEWWLDQKKKTIHPRISSRSAYNYYICPYCYVFLKNDNIVQHLRKHECQNSKVQCAYCYLNFNHEGLQAHMKTKHADFYKKFNLLSNINCQLCSALLALNDIPCHMIRHKKGLPIISPRLYCAYCELLMTDEELKFHMQLESGKCRDNVHIVTSLGNKKETPPVTPCHTVLDNNTDSSTDQVCLEDDKKPIEKVIVKTEDVGGVPDEESNNQDSKEDISEHVEVNDQPVDFNIIKKTYQKYASDRKCNKSSSQTVHTHASNITTATVLLDETAVNLWKEKRNRKNENEKKLDMFRSNGTSSTKEEETEPDEIHEDSLTDFKEEDDCSNELNNNCQIDIDNSPEKSEKVESITNQTSDNENDVPAFFTMRLRRKKGTQEYENASDDPTNDHYEIEKIIPEIISTERKDESNAKEEVLVRCAEESDEEEVLVKSEEETKPNVQEDKGFCKKEQEVVVEIDTPERRSNRNRIKTYEKHETRSTTSTSSTKRKQYTNDDVHHKDTKGKTAECLDVLNGRKRSRKTPSEDTEKSESVNSKSEEKLKSTINKSKPDVKIVQSTEDKQKNSKLKESTKKSPDVDSNMKAKESVESKHAVSIEEKKKSFVKPSVEVTQTLEVKRSKRLSIKRDMKEGNVVAKTTKSKSNISSDVQQDTGEKEKKVVNLDVSTGNKEEIRTEVLSTTQKTNKNERNTSDKRKDDSVGEEVKAKVLSAEERKAGCDREVTSFMVGLEKPKCTICDWTLSTFDDLKLHLLKHIYDPDTEIKLSSRNVRCALCLKLIRKTSIKTHLVIVHQREVYQQNKLEKSIERKETPLNELKSESLPNGMAFNVSVDFGFQEALPYPFNCAVCAKGYFTSSPYLSHFKNIHPWLYEDVKEKLSTNKNCKKKGKDAENSDLPSTTKKGGSRIEDKAESSKTEKHHKKSKCVDNTRKNDAKVEDKKDVETEIVTCDTPDLTPIRKSKRRKEMKQRDITSEMSEVTNKQEKVDTKSNIYKEDNDRELKLQKKTKNQDTSVSKRENKANIIPLNTSSPKKSKGNHNLTNSSIQDSEEKSISVETDEPQKNKNKFNEKVRDKTGVQGSSNDKGCTEKSREKKNDTSADVSDDSDGSSSEVEEETEEEIIESSSSEEEENDVPLSTLRELKHKVTPQSTLSGSKPEVTPHSSLSSSKQEVTPHTDLKKAETVFTNDGCDKTSSENLYCHQCNAQFTSQLELNMHLIVHKNNPERFFNVPYPYVCLFCGNGYYRTYMLKKHLQSKHSDFYTLDLEKTPSFMRRGPGLEQDYEKATKPTDAEVILPKRDHSRFSAVLHNVTGRPTRIDSVIEDNETHDKGLSEEKISEEKIPEEKISEEKIPEEKIPEVKTSETPEETSISERRVSGRKRAINKDVLEFLQGSKCRTPQKEEKGNTTESDIDRKESIIKKKYESKNTTKDTVESSSDESMEEDTEQQQQPPQVDLKEIEASEESNKESDDSGEESSNKQSRHSFVCKYCDWLLQSYSELSRHKKKHNRGIKKNSNELVCLCCKKSVYRHDLKWHMHTVHSGDDKVSLKSSKKKYCLKCNYACKRKKDLEDHVGCHHPELLKVECRLCDDRFSTKLLYTEHFKIAHGKSMDEETLTCYLCNKKFKSLPKLHHHYSIVHMKKNENISCSLCSKFFYGQTDLDKHREKFHKNDKFQCGLCLVEFEGVEQCEEHVIIHKEKSNFKCKLCNFYFESNEVLTNHVTTHETHTLTCNVCNGNFKTINEYQTHKAIHTNEGADPTHVCMNCSQTFDTAIAFDEHSKGHCVNKTYTCSSCDKTFKMKSEIQAHMDKVHHGGTHAICSDENEPTDDEPITQEDDVRTINHCKECGQTFVRSEIFEEHLKKHLPKTKENNKKPLPKSRKKRGK